MLNSNLLKKIHAYTLLRRNDNKNSRVKDMIDVFLLIDSDLIDKKLLAKSIKKVFGRRKTHHIPKKLEMFPEEWKKSFEYLAASCGINSKIEEVYKILAEYYVSIINK